MSVSLLLNSWRLLQLVEFAYVSGGAGNLENFQDLVQIEYVCEKVSFVDERA